MTSCDGCGELIDTRHEVYFVTLGVCADYYYHPVCCPDGHDDCGCLDAPIAQRTEQFASNEEVRGSSPCRSANG